MYRVKLTTYPNNETRAVFVRLPPPKPETYTDESSPCQCPDSVVVEPINQSVLVNPLFLTLGANSATPPEPVENSEKPGWGGLPSPSRFGLNARRNLLRRGGMLDRVAGSPNEVLLCTGTVPNGFDDGRITTAAYSAYIVYTLKKWFQRKVVDKWDMYCWEFQGRGALHLHYAIWIPDTALRTYYLNNFKRVWCEILYTVYQKTGVDLLVSANGYTDKDNWQYVQAKAEEVYASLGAYLSKYLGKLEGKHAASGDKVLYPPTRWWGCSRPLTKSTRDATIELEAYSIKQGEMLTLYEDIDTLLEGHSEIHHSYPCKHAFAFTSVAYKTTHIGLEICHMAMQRTSSYSKPNNSQTWEERTCAQLSAIARTFSFTPDTFSKQYTQPASQAVEKLFNGHSMSIIEAIQVVDGIAWLLYWRYRKRQQTHASLSRAENRCTTIKQEIYQRMMDKSQSITSPLAELN